MLLAAGTEHTLLWLEQTAETKHSEGFPPTSTWAELPQAGQENSPWKEGAAVIFPSWALQLC